MPKLTLIIMLSATAAFADAGLNDPAYDRATTVEVAGRSFLVEIAGREVRVTDKSRIVRITLAERDAQREAVDIATGCKLVDELYSPDGRLRGRLGCSGKGGDG